MAEASRLQRKVDYGLLYAFYGPLLTERQRLTILLYTDEDMSLGEVAKQLGVSRQCVSNTLQRAFERLQKLETEMGLWDRFEAMRHMMLSCKNMVDAVLEGKQGKEKLREVSGMLRDYLNEEEA